MKRRVLAAVLSLVMVFSLASMCFAAEETQIAAGLTSSPFTDTTADANSAYEYTIIGSDGSSETVRIAAVNTDTGNGVEPADDATVTYFTKLDNPANVDGSVPALLVYEYNGSTYAVNTSKRGTPVTVVGDRIDTDDTDCQWTITRENSSYTIKNGVKYLGLDWDFRNGWSVSLGGSKTTLSGTISNDGIQFRRTVRLFVRSDTRYLGVENNSLTPVNNNEAATFYIYQKTTETVSGKYKVNHEGLDALLGQAFTEAEYTTDSWAAYEAAKQAAQDAITALKPYYDTEAEANEALQTINAAHNDLQAAIDGLKEREIQIPEIEWQRTLEPAHAEAVNAAGDNCGALVTGVLFNSADYATISWDWNAVSGLTTDPDMVVWDYGTASQYSAAGEATGKVSAATWNEHETGTASSAWNDASVRKFAGTFTWPSGYDVDDYAVISSVNDANYQFIYDYIASDNELSERFGGQKVIPINDDMYVFVYKDGDVLTENNYLDHLVFWTGTSGKGVWSSTGSNGDDWRRVTPPTFNDVNALPAYHEVMPNMRDVDRSAAVTRSGFNKDNMQHSDGWYTLVDTSTLMSTLKNLYGTASLEGSQIHIDIYCFDNSANGGMDKLQITFEKAPETTAPVTVKYYLNSVYGTLLGTTSMGPQEIGSEITLNNGTNINELNHKKASAITANSNQDVRDGAQQGTVPYVVHEGENVINVVYTANDYTEKVFVYDFGTENVFQDVIDEANLNGLQSVAATGDNNSNVSFTKNANNNYDLHFNPKDAADNAIQSVKVALTYTYDGTAVVYKDIVLIPASNVLYEENFMKPVEGVYEDWNLTGNTIAAVTDNANTVYGYTSAYANCTGANGQYTASVAKNNSTDDLKFTFTGTGFDLIAQCGASTGTLMVRVDDENGNYVKSYLVDTSFNDSNVGNNLYQVPVIHEQNLKNGTYTVTIFGAYIDYNAASSSNASPASTFSMRSVGSSAIDTIYELADRMGLSGDDLDSMEFINVDQLYGASTYAMASAVRTASTGTADTESVATMTLGIDGFRVYRDTGNSAYKTGEKDMVYVNVLDAVYDSFVGYVESTGDGSYTSGNYETNGGPQNEIYLSAGNAATFQTGLEDGTVVQVSARAVSGTAYLNGEAIQSQTEMYYTVTVGVGGVITIGNTPPEGTTEAGMLAIANLKVPKGLTFDAPTEQTFVTAFAMMRSYSAAPTEPDPEQPGTEEPEPTPVFTPETFKTRVNSIRTRNRKIVTLTITASTDVDHVVVNGKTYYPMNKLLVKWGLSKTYVFTIMDTAGASETRSFEIVAYNADGLASIIYTDAG